jgi:hypothetical protein
MDKTIQWSTDTKNSNQKIFLVSFGHCIVCPSLITVFGIVWSLYCLSFSDYCDWYHLVIVLSVRPKEEGQTIQWPNEEGQTIQWPKRRTDNTMTKKGQTIQWPKEGQTIQWPKEGQTISCPSLITVFSIFWSLHCLVHLWLLCLVSFVHCIVCPSSIFWLLFLVSFGHCRQYNDEKRTDNTMTKRRTDNTMTKRRTDNTMTKRRTDNTMTKGRRTDNTTTKRTDNAMTNRRTDNTMTCPSFGHCIVCSTFGHCIVCPSFGHCIVCPSVGHCIMSFFLLTIVLCPFFSWP